ncbi:MAG: hypothetical protein KJ964_09995, partial [Verrucomicrobia bacterium]|nr:hypothetical protein [Verrucomicrobiota bacterium]
LFIKATQGGLKPPPARRLREVFAFSHLLRSCDLLLSVLIFVAHIRFAKGIGDPAKRGINLEPPVGLPRSHGMKSYASHGAPTSGPSLVPRQTRDCLAFANPPLAETKFATRLHRASRRATPDISLTRKSMVANGCIACCLAMIYGNNTKSSCFL